jgi:hypothetical protein
MENKQTAVEWLVQVVQEANLLENNGWILPLIQQAKKMEKQQIENMYSEEEVIKAYHDAYHKGYRVGQKDAESHPLALTIANNIHIDRNKWFEQFKK